MYLDYKNKMLQVQILFTFINDVIDEISEEYDLILGKTEDDVKNVKESYKYLFTGITIFTGFIITMISAFIIDFSVGVGILFLVVIVTVLTLLKRQRRIRKLNDAYGEYIAVLGQKKSAFIKIRKKINYYENIRAEIIIQRDDYLTPKNIRNVLHALDTIDYAYHLYYIKIYRKLFPVVETDAKRSIFVGLIHHLKNSISTIKELSNITSMALPYYIHDEVNKILNDNIVYIPKNFKEPLVSPVHEIYLSFNDYTDVKYGSGWNYIKLVGIRKYSEQIQKLKNQEFLLDENLEIVKIRNKSKLIKS